MLTRRSRKEAGATSPEASSLEATSPTPRRRSKSKPKSVEKKRIRTRSRSANKSVPKVVIERISVPEKKKRELKKKSIEPVDSKFRKSPTPVNRSNPIEDKINNSKVSSRNSPILDYDEESDSGEPMANNTRTLSLEFGGSFSNIVLALLLPILVIIAKIALKSKGILIPFPRGYLRFANYYDQDVFLWTAAIVIFQLVISAIPLFKKSKGFQNDDSNPIFYRFSGPVHLILIVGILIANTLEYYKLPLNFIQEIATKKSVPHIVVSVLCAFIISIALYIKAKYTSVQNVHNKQTANSLNVIQNLFIGTTSNPTLGPINIKLALYRYSILLTILFNYVVIMDSLKNPINIHLYVVAGFQILYALDKLIFEFNLLSSFYLQKEKDGYWTLIQPFLQPSINFLPVQILLVNNLPVNYIILSISSVLFLIGLFCQRYSEFTRYQYENKSSYAGRKVNDGLWSFVRYPNYLGTILIHLAVILPAFVPNLASLQASWPIILYPLYYIVTLSHRSVRVSSYNRSQYGYVWDLNTVKWNLIPKVF